MINGKDVIYKCAVRADIVQIIIADYAGDMQIQL